MTIGRGPGAQFFRLVNQSIRKSIQPFVPPAAWYQSHDDSFGEIWFPSYGCPWSLLGSCSMCNYGRPLPPNENEMVQAVAIGLASFDKIPEVLWVSAFDVLDPRDVPIDVRRRIFRLLRRTSAHRVISEAHPTLVTYDVVKECVDLLEGKIFGLELGVETMDDFVRAWCIQKSFLTAQALRAIDHTRKAGAEVYVNLFVGAPFLSSAEVVQDSVKSIHECLAAGVTSVVLLPCHLKAHTLGEWLHKQDLYKPPSLWTLVEILTRVGREHLPHIKLAWVVAKDHPGHPVIMRPRADRGAPSELLEALAEFDRTGNGTALRPLLQSSAYAEWRRELDCCADLSLGARLAKALPIIGEGILGAEWWADNGAAVRMHLETDWLQYENSQA